MVFQKLDDGAVLFSPDTELYFGLNEAGVLVWELLPPATSGLDDLVAAVAARYPDAPPAVIAADVEELVEALVREGLALGAGAGGDGAPAP